MSEIQSFKKFESERALFLDVVEGTPDFIAVKDMFTHNIEVYKSYVITKGSSKLVHIGNDVDGYNSLSMFLKSKSVAAYAFINDVED